MTPTDDIIPLWGPEWKQDKLPILVWPFHEAPESLRKLSTSGGDEDWIAHVPKHFAGRYIAWLETGGFGVCDVEKIEIADGSIVYIGSHA